MSTDEEAAGRARETILRAIADQAERAPNASTLLRLAEAYAWMIEPAQPHGGREG